MRPTWHQGLYSEGGFWEWIGPWGINSWAIELGKEGINVNATWEEWADGPYAAEVHHKQFLPSSAQRDPPNTNLAYDWTVYGVARVPDTVPFRPPLIGDAEATEAPS